MGLPPEPRRRRRAASDSGTTIDGVTRQHSVQDLPSHSNACRSPPQQPDDAFDSPSRSADPHSRSLIDGYDPSARPIPHDLQFKQDPSLSTHTFAYGGGRSTPPASYVYITPPTYTPAHSAPSENYFDIDPTIVPGPSLSYTRQTWWDSLLALYASSGDPLEHSSLTLTPTQREAASNHVLYDVKFLFRVTPYLFCFFNVPRFFSLFSDHARRLELQPSYILAMLAVATFLQSSETGLGTEGRNQALRLRDEAQSALDASLNAGRLDHDLAKAAWVRLFIRTCRRVQNSPTPLAYRLL